MTAVKNFLYGHDPHIRVRLKQVIIFLMVIHFMRCAPPEKSSNRKTDDVLLQMIHANKLKSDSIPPEGLLKWDFYGIGSLSDASHGQVLLSEYNHSKGAMIISPEVFGDVVVCYDVMTLQAASVVVAMLAMSSGDNYENLVLPQDYDGSFDIWLKENNYFFGVHVASHNFNPFLRRCKQGNYKMMAQTDKSILTPGVYYHVEIGNIEGRLWLKINDQTLIDVKDPKPLGPGKLSLRVRGTAHERGSYLIKNFVVWSPNKNH